VPPKSRTAIGTGPDSTIRSIGVDGALAVVDVPVDAAVDSAVDSAVDVAGMLGSGAMGMVILRNEGRGQ
jgi:hypothetical protein